MNRATRDKFASATGRDVTSGNAVWETAPNVFAKLNEDFGPFDVDLTADATRRLCGRWYGPGSTGSVECEDVLAVADWSRGGLLRRGYSNPPYGPFVQKMLEAAKRQAAEHGFASMLLLPMRVTKAFRAHVLDGAAGLWFCDKRLVFYEDGAPRINPKTGKPDAAMFDSIIVTYRPDHVGPPVVGVWEVPQHGTEPSYGANRAA